MRETKSSFKTLKYEMEDREICFFTQKELVFIFRKQDVLTIKNFNDLLADEVLDFIIIHHSLLKNRKIGRHNANIN